MARCTKSLKFNNRISVLCHQRRNVRLSTVRRNYAFSCRETESRILQSVSFQANWRSIYGALY